MSSSAHSLRPQPRRGLVLGKFMPPHAGHQYLVDFARHYVDQLAVVVGSLSTEPIPGDLRWQWMRDLFPQAEVLHLAQDLPQDPSEADDFWKQWREALLQILPWPVDFVFASETYGERLAQELGAEFIPVDLGRACLPVSGTLIREQPLKYWDFLPAVVRPYFLKRVCIFGPESTGKSTLAKRLATHYQTLAVPEYAQIVLQRQAGQICLEDISKIAQGQQASEQALALQANRVLFCDTDLLTTCLWSEELFGEVPEGIWQQARSQNYDLYLLCDIDVPWVDDAHRLRPQGRSTFLQSCQSLLEREGRPFDWISGSWEQRWQQARKALDAVLD